MNAGTKDFTSGGLRVSDADRDRAIAELSEHFEAGRITSDEFDERSSRALRARTEGDLAGLFADLPRRRAAASPPAPSPGPADGLSPRLGPVGPLHSGLELPGRLSVARIAIIAIAAAAVAGGLTSGSHHSLLLLAPVLVVLVVIRRLSRYR